MGSISLTNFSGGINNFVDPKLIKETEAQELVNAKVSNGVIVPLTINEKISVELEDAKYYENHKRSVIQWNKKFYWTDNEKGGFSGKDYNYISADAPKAEDFTLSENDTENMATEAENINFKDVCYSATLGKFVGVGENIMGTSPDGLTWRVVTCEGEWCSVACGTTYIIAVQRSPIIAKSVDGVNWTTENAKNTDNGNIGRCLYKIVAGGNAFVCLGYDANDNNASEKIYWTTSDVMKWKSVDLYQVGDVIFDSHTSKFVVVGSNKSYSFVTMTKGTPYQESFVKTTLKTKLMGGRILWTGYEYFIRDASSNKSYRTTDLTKEPVLIGTEWGFYNSLSYISSFVVFNGYIYGKINADGYLYKAKINASGSYGKPTRDVYIGEFVNTVLCVSANLQKLLCTNNNTAMVLVKGSSEWDTTGSSYYERKSCWIGRIVYVLSNGEETGYLNFGETKNYKSEKVRYNSRQIKYNQAAFPSNVEAVKIYANLDNSGSYYLIPGTTKTINGVETEVTLSAPDAFVKFVTYEGDDADTMDDWITRELYHNLDENANEPPPDNGKFLTEYQGTFFVACGNEIAFSVSGSLTQWSSLYRINFDGEITGIAREFNGILVFTKNKTYRLTNVYSYETITKDVVPAVLGCINWRSIVYVDNTPCWMSNDGLCAWDGSNIKLLGYGKIDWNKYESFLYSACADGVIYMVFANTVLCYNMREGGSFYETDDIGHNDMYYDSDRDMLLLFDVDAVSGNTQKDCLLFCGGKLYRNMKYKSAVLGGVNIQLKRFNNIFMYNNGEAEYKITASNGKSISIKNDKRGRYYLPYSFLAENIVIEATGNAEIKEIVVTTKEANA